MDVLDVASEIWNASQGGLRGLEVEFRLGHTVGDTFLAHVKKETFDAIRAHVESLHVIRKIQIHTSEKLLNGVRHITTLSIQEGGEDKPPPPLVCMRKTKSYTGNVGVHDSPYQIRCSIAREKNVSTPPPTPSDVCMVRQKQRTRYIVDKWAYDLTVVTTNSDDEETYEVELELYDVSSLFRVPMDVVACDGLARMHAALQSN